MSLGPVREPATYSIRREKLVCYLLDPHHPVGGPKAKFFIGLGFSPNDPDLLARALLHHARTPDHRIAVIPTRHGHKLICEGPLSLAPNGTAPTVRSVLLMADDTSE